MKGLCIAVAFSLLAGCATEAKYQSNMNSWVGQDELKLIRKWGPPERTYEVEGSKFLQYSFSNTLSFAATPTVSNTSFDRTNAQTTTIHGVAPQDIVYACATTFEVREAKIINWTSKGGGCVAE